jgi:hypothetical protein
VLHDGYSQGSLATSVARQTQKRCFMETYKKTILLCCVSSYFRFFEQQEHHNAHKRKQLMELAEMNGTVRAFDRLCRNCGEAGHPDWKCPKQQLTTFQAKITCSICGDGGHPSVDCPRKGMVSSMLPLMWGCICSVWGGKSL